jgi:hypothetical protein
VRAIDLTDHDVSSRSSVPVVLRLGRCNLSTDDSTARASTAFAVFLFPREAKRKLSGALTYTPLYGVPKSRVPIPSMYHASYYWPVAINLEAARIDSRATGEGVFKVTVTHWDGAPPQHLDGTYIPERLRSLMNTSSIIGFYVITLPPDGILARMLVPIPARRILRVVLGVCLPDRQLLLDVPHQFLKARRVRFIQAAMFATLGVLSAFTGPAWACAIAWLGATLRWQSARAIPGRSKAVIGFHYGSAKRVAALFGHDYSPSDGTSSDSAHLVPTPPPQDADRAR